jgi:dienelactone hydrolase
MDVQLKSFAIAVDDEELAASVLTPARELPGVLFVHGWGGSQEQDLGRAKNVAGLGCVCVTFDLRGHPGTPRQQTISRPENLVDLVSAYDWLADQPQVDARAIAVVGISYGGYLATLLTLERRVRWLALRSPALYKDADWSAPKLALHREGDLRTWRRQRIDADGNRALAACERFEGDVLLVEAGRDDIVPHPVIENYMIAFARTRSLTRRLVGEADHAFSDKSMQGDYSRILLGWLTEMIAGARTEAATREVASHKARQGPRSA